MKSYVTLQQIKAKGYLDLMDVTDYDDVLLDIMHSASSELDNLTYRHFNTWEGTIYCDGSGRTLIPSEDILSLSAVSLDLDGSQQWATSLSSSDYFMYPLDGYHCYPKTELKMSLNCAAGGFAPGIISGVKLTGIFGYGNGVSPTPYKDGGLTGTVATTTGTTLTLSTPGVIQAGQTLRLGTEQMYVASAPQGVSSVTVERGSNGTTPAIHSGDEIYLYTYPGDVIEAARLLVVNWWKQRENPTIFRAGNSITGEYEISTDIEKIMTKRLNHYIKRKLV